MFVCQGVSGVGLVDDGEAEEELEDSEDEEQPQRYCIQCSCFNQNLRLMVGCVFDDPL